MLNRCAWYMYGREMVLNRLALILVCPCTDHPPIRPMYTVSRSFSYSTPNVFRHISSASRLLVRVTIASTSRGSIQPILFSLFIWDPSPIIFLPCPSIPESLPIVRLDWCASGVWRSRNLSKSHITFPCLTFWPNQTNCWSLVRILKLYFCQDFEDSLDQDFFLNFWYDLNKGLW